MKDYELGNAVWELFGIQYRIFDKERFLKEYKLVKREEEQDESIV